MKGLIEMKSKESWKHFITRCNKIFRDMYPFWENDSRQNIRHLAQPNMQLTTKQYYPDGILARRGSIVMVAPPGLGVRFVNLEKKEATIWYPVEIHTELDIN